MNIGGIVEKPVAFLGGGACARTLLRDARRGRNYGS